MRDDTYESLEPYQEEQDWDFSKNEPGFVFGDYRWVLTCMACPEQYDVFYQDKLVAYARLRGGNYVVANNCYYDIEFYRHKFEGDQFKGSFDSQEERGYYVSQAQAKVEQYYNRS